ncbi:MAG: hypothetical protein JSU61_03270 [Fidelibacterota bacterium]|nr:MAG: hypothetical protein JSU61_03270 [Candidatus Neomarinimicrobiota bacterium]
MGRSLLIPLSVAFGCGLVLASPQDERLRLLSADLLENVQSQGQTVQILTGHVKFRKGEMELTTDRATFYRSQERSHLSGNVVMVRPGERLTCDSLVFYGRDDRIHAWSDTVRFVTEEDTITCREFIYWTELDSAIARYEVVMTQAGRQLVAEEFHYQKKEGPRGASFRALGSVVILEGDRRVTGQRMTYDDMMEVLELYGDAVVQEGDRDLRGKHIHLQYQDEVLETGAVHEGAEATALIQAQLSADTRSWRTFVDVLTSREMKADFMNNRLSRLKLDGMATSIYHVVEDSILQGVNHATGDTLTLDFDADSRLVRIRVKGGARGRFVPERGNSDVDTMVVYQADYIDYDLPAEVTYLERGARVDYKNNGLAAGYIKVTWQDNLMRAELAFDEQPTLHQRGHDPMYGQLMEFDLVNEMGRVVKGKTKLENGHYHGELVHRYPGNVYYVRRSLYTTCALDTPHFYFAARQMKMLQGDKVIAKPIILYLMDVPVIGLPFIVFPNESGGRRTGWIMPSYGQSSRDGRYLEGLGYFWAINSYMDATGWLDLFDQKGIRVKGRLRYNRRYNFSGELNASLFRIIGRSDISDLFTPNLAANEWSASWRHSQTIDPTQRVNVNARYTSSPGIFRKGFQDLQTRLTQQIVSNASYSKNWPGTSNRLTLALQEKYDLQAQEKQQTTTPSQLGQKIVEKSRTLPRISFGRASAEIFKPAKGQRPRWYHNIRWSLNSSLNNHQSVFWDADTLTVQTVGYDTTRIDDSLVVDTVAVDSLTYFWSEDMTVLNRMWAENNINLQATQTVLRYITLNLNLGINQDWTPRYRKAFLDTATEEIDYRWVEEVAVRHTGRISLSASTKLYGLFPLHIGSIEALRHVLTPSISYNFTPDFSKPVFGVDLGYFPKGPDGVSYDKFTGSPIGNTPKGESQSMSISLANLFQTKRLVDGQEVKTNLLTWTMSTNYNFTADSLNLSTLRSSFRSPFLQKLNMDISMEHDVYEWDEATESRINKIRTIPRLVRMDARTSLRLSGKRLVPLAEQEPDTAATAVDTLASEYESEDDQMTMTFRRGITKPTLARGNLWEATLGVRYGLVPTRDPEKRETFWLNGDFKINIGPGWNVRYSARFNLLTQELVSHDLQLYRQIHCWEFSFSWTPTGYGRGFMLRINVLDADLQDIKYENRGGRQSGLWF